METKELRQFSPEELKVRVKQWREELFRIRFKGQSQELKDISVFKKMKRDIARALTVLVEKTKLESKENGTVENKKKS